MRLSGLLIKRPTMRELNLVLLPILFVLLIVYLLIAISYQEGNPFINNVFTFDREDSSAPWFSVVIAVTIVQMGLVVSGFYGAIKRRLEYFKPYVGGLIGIMTVSFILVAQLMIFQQTETIYVGEDPTFYCLGNGTILIHPHNTTDLLTPQEYWVDNPDLHDIITYEEYTQDLIDLCSSTRVVHLLLLGIIGFVLPIAGCCPCFGAGLRYAMLLSVEQKEISIEITTAPFGGNEPSERIPTTPKKA